MDHETATKPVRTSTHFASKHQRGAVDGSPSLFSWQTSETPAGVIRQCSFRWDAMRFFKPIVIGSLSAIAGGVVGWFANDWMSIDRTIVEATEALKQGKIDLALRLAQLQIRQSPKYQPEAERLVARCLAHQKKWSEAARVFEQTVCSTAEDFALFSIAYYQNQRPKDAMAVCQTGLERFPGDPRLSELETRLYGFHSLAKEALGSAERLKAIPGKKVTGLLLGGMVHFQAKNYQSAADWLRQALELSPTLEGQSDDFQKIGVDEVNDTIAASLLETENRADALPFAERAFRLKPKTERAVMAANACGALNRVDEQRRWLDRALELAPNHVDAMLLKIDLELGEGRLDVVKREIEAISKVPAEPQYKHRLDLARARLGAAQKIADSKAKRKQ